MRNRKHSLLGKLGLGLAGDLLLLALVILVMSLFGIQAAANAYAIVFLLLLAGTVSVVLFKAARGKPRP